MRSMNPISTVPEVMALICGGISILCMCIVTEPLICWLSVGGAMFKRSAAREMQFRRDSREVTEVPNFHLKNMRHGLIKGQGLFRAMVASYSPPPAITARICSSGPKSSAASIDINSASRVRARLTRDLMVPTAHPQMWAASS